MIFKKFTVTLISLLVYSLIFGQNTDDALYKSDKINPVRAVAEIGYLGVFSHKVSLVIPEPTSIIKKKEGRMSYFQLVDFP